MRQDIARDDIRQHRLQARLLEGAAGADDESHGKQKPGRQPAAKIRGGKNRDRERLDELRDEGDAAAIVPVGDMAGRQKEANRRDELDEPDQSEMERAAGQFIHLPADRDDLDLQRDRRRDPHIEKTQIGGMAHSGIAGEGWCVIATIVTRHGGPCPNRDAGRSRPSLTRRNGSPKWRPLAKNRRNIGRLKPMCLDGGAVAQLGERLVRNEEVRGSTPLGSTKLRRSCRWLRIGLFERTQLASFCHP